MWRETKTWWRQSFFSCKFHTGVRYGYTLKPLKLWNFNIIVWAKTTMNFEALANTKKKCGLRVSKPITEAKYKVCDTTISTRAIEMCASPEPQVSLSHCSSTMYFEH